jgi:hypothetical protein
MEREKLAGAMREQQTISKRKVPYLKRWSFEWNISERIRSHLNGNCAEGKEDQDSLQTNVQSQETDE